VNHGKVEIVELDSIPHTQVAITHIIECEPSKLIEAVSGGWPKVICNLKSRWRPARPF
jgi:hypothetical protein